SCCLGAPVYGGEVAINRRGMSTLGAGAHLLARSRIAEREGASDEQAESFIRQSASQSQYAADHHVREYSADEPVNCPRTVPPNRRVLKFRGSGNGAAKFAGPSPLPGACFCHEVSRSA